MSSDGFYLSSFINKCMWCKFVCVHFFKRCSAVHISIHNCSRAPTSHPAVTQPSSVLYFKCLREELWPPWLPFCCFRCTSVLLNFQLLRTLYLVSVALRKMSRACKNVVSVEIQNSSYLFLLSWVLFLFGKSSLERQYGQERSERHWDDIGMRRSTGIQPRTCYCIVSVEW